MSFTIEYCCYQSCAAPCSLPPIKDVSQSGFAKQDRVCIEGYPGFFSPFFLFARKFQTSVTSFEPSALRRTCWLMF
jgi:hypothetical protein